MGFVLENKNPGFYTSLMMGYTHFFFFFFFPHLFFFTMVDTNEDEVPMLPPTENIEKCNIRGPNNTLRIIFLTLCLAG